ncbi:MAG: hypothetical protein V7767_10555 [Leeuwenhoekiella sp.]
MDGKIFISLDQEYFTGYYELSHIPTGSQGLSFTLNEKIKVEQIYLNGDPIASSKNARICWNCTVHNILISRPLEESDTLQIKVKGKFKKNKEGGNFENEIFISKNLVVAKGSSKWYPVLIAENIADRNITDENDFRKYPMTYDIRVDGEGYKYVSIGSENLKLKSGRFSSQVPNSDISLVAGNFDYKKGKYATYLNVEDKDVRFLDENYRKIKDYYRNKTGLSIEAKPILVSLDKLGSENFDPNSSDVITNMSYSIANDLLNANYNPTTQYSSFYRDVFVKYLSLRYLRDNFPLAYISEVRKLDGEDAFIRLDELVDIKDLRKVDDIRVIPFQFLAIENFIGEDKMLSLINTIFEKSEEGDMGYLVLKSSLVALGINQNNIAQIEDKIITEFPANSLFPNEKIIVSW